ncbi:uncharacterized protein LOC143295391 [Babylonia areolata]|uniref:uncharacterized protein LOC143295391 n=1 Tax=Babylonia areolata TaxID=304850 RepID=UPI003FD43306
MHEMVGNFHQMVTQIDTLKDSNMVLKETCGVLEQEMKTKEKQNQEQLQEQKKETEEKLTLVIQSREKEAESERQRMVRQLEEKNQMIVQLQEAIAKAKKEKEDEITVLSMEYENKLAKIQRQKSQILQNAQQSTNQDIFRKKLTHLKKTHEEEVCRLKQHIAQLQSQAATPPPAASPHTSHFSSNIFTTRAKRK